jgi:hypothetical protein
LPKLPTGWEASDADGIGLLGWYFPRLPTLWEASDADGIRLKGDSSHFSREKKLDVPDSKNADRLVTGSPEPGLAGDWRGRWSTPAIERPASMRVTMRAGHADAHYDEWKLDASRRDP